MVSDTAITESQLAAITAEEYRNRGYEVLREVPLDFVPGFRADLLVRKDGHSKVIEVSTRSSLARRSILKDLGRMLNAKPGWSFELLLVGEPEKLAAPPGSHSLPQESIVRRLSDAERAGKAGFPEAAFLLTWSAAEAVIRDLIASEGVGVERVTTPDYLLDLAVYHGTISRDDYDYLSGLMTYRNALAHGFGIEDFDDGLTATLTETVKRLMASPSDQP